MRHIYLFTLFFLGLASISAQSLTGTNGLFKTPSAAIMPDGMSYLGVSFYPKGYYELYNAGDQFTGMPSFITLSLYDRVEFMFRYTHQLGQEVSPQTSYFPDRMFTLRYNILKEKNNQPALTLGLHDVSEALGGTSATPWFVSTYLVTSKTIQKGGITLIPNIGYAFDLIDQKRNQVFKGIFGGVEVFSSHLPALSAVVEYDSQNLNAALKTTLFGHLHLAVGLLELKAISGFVTYRFNLSSR